MNYSEFLEDAVVSLQETMKTKFEDMKIEISDVEKVQGESYTGLAFRTHASNVGVCINPGPYFAMYQQGLPLEDALERLLQDVMHAMDNPVVSDSVDLKYENCRDRLMLELIPQEGNEEQLKRLPWKPVLDLALIVRIDFGKNENGWSSAVVSNSMMKGLKVTQEQLFNDALEAAGRHQPMNIWPMSNFVEGFKETVADEVMFVASSNDMFMGASVLAYPDFGEKASELLGDDFYIIPSSIHEVILVPERKCPDAQMLPFIVKMVNMQEVAPEDRLSDNVYFYSREKQKICKYEVPVF